ncbi:MAG: bifunctional aspartate kinase/homoserine dehydrogenase I, partial [Myxococcales bacterium]|nr:bifunctional aspartate kinase/homoserine dehydrogenase I [Myxococcales bacterium]
VAIVVSAMGDTTDWLIEAAEAAARGEPAAATAIADKVAELALSNGLIAIRTAAARDGFEPPTTSEVTAIVRGFITQLRQILEAVGHLRECSAQTMDLILSFGERISASVLAELLRIRGVGALYVDARDWMVTDDTFGRAVVDVAATGARLAELRARWGERVPVNTGFLGRTPDGRTTTLGRNGSDYTASLLAQGLRAAEVIVWTDVSGVMTADPGIVQDAYPIARLSYMEALELANFGARMFHPRTMIPLIESQIPMRIRNTMRPEAPGTRIATTGAVDEERPTSVTSLENLSLLALRWRKLTQQAKVGSRVLKALEAAGVTVWMATQSAHGQTITVVVPQGEQALAVEAIRDELAFEFDRNDVEPLAVRAPVTLLTLVAETMSESLDAAGRFFEALSELGITVRAIAQGESSRSISCAIDAQDTRLAVRTVHTAFNFAHQELSLVLMGKGTVGGHLLRQIRQQQEALEQEHDVALRVVGLLDSRHEVFDAAGLDLSDVERLLAERGEPRAAEGFEALLERLGKLPVPILVDCTAASGMERLYEEAFLRGIHVVGANKKPLTVPQGAWAQLMGAARRSHRAYQYETTVGASLPVIETLKNLVRTGDRVRRIEGSFSGTLGYLTNEVMGGRSLSEAVRTAHRLGYTEPRPQDDLSGLDVARKALILARELGLELNLSDVEVEPLVPPELLAEEDRETFFAALEAYDPTFDARINDLRRDGRALRYLARIDPSGPTVQVGPVGIDSDHPATRLRGSEAFVAFMTERYSDYPLIVQGAGAGGAVTAAGVLADVLSIAQTLRGR